MFKVKANFKMSDIEAYIKAETESWFDELVDKFRQKGRDIVDRARAKTKDDGGFGNITWNLRSSIGYLLSYNDQVIETYFPPLASGEEGSVTGEAFAREVANYVNDRQGIQLIVVAGMEYATFVERNDGRDVITHVVGDNLGPELQRLLA